MLFSATLFFSTVIAACLAQSNHEPIKAVAVFSGMSNVAGSIHFVQDSPQSPTTIFANMTGLSAGEHGLHIHEFGDLTNGIYYNNRSSLFKR
jgi:Cu-Zn family superoxide dismutase